MTKKTNIVYLSGNIREGVGLEIWRGILKKAKKIDANLICYTGGELGEDSSSLVYNLIDVDKMDGFIGHAASERDMHLLYYEKFKDHPFIALSLPIPGYPVVMTESYKSMRKVVEHLARDHAYRKIAFVRGPDNHPYANERFRAYRDIMKEYGIFDSRLITPPMGFSAPSGRKAIRYLLDEKCFEPGKDLEAVVFVSDTVAISACRELELRHITIPDQIAVTGFNAEREACCMSPSMTTVCLPFAEQGDRAIELLMRKIDGKKIPEKTILPASLIVARSCGCPGKDLSLRNQIDNLISEAELRRRERDHLKRIHLEETLRNISTKLISTYNMSSLLNILTDTLSELEIPGCYISLFEDSGNITSLFDPPEQAKIIFAYEEGRRKELKGGGLMYPSRDLLPHGFPEKQEKKVLIVHSLNYNTAQIGFVVFELGPEEGFVYFALSRLLSSFLENKYEAFLMMLNEGVAASAGSSHFPGEQSTRYYFSNLGPNRPAGDYVLYAGMETRDNKKGPNGIPAGFYRLEIVAGGKGEIEISGTSSSLLPGFACIVGPAAEYRIRSDRMDPLKRYFLVFQGGKLLEESLAGGYELGMIIQLSNLNDIIDLIELLFREASGNKSFRDSISTEYLHLILCKIRESQLSENIFVNVYSERFQTCKNYIDKNYLSIHTMDDMVNDLNIQKTYICRLFKMFNHESPYRYLMRRKMNHAYDMLTRSNTLVRIVADEIGFEDPYHFSKVFKKTFLKSPREVRQMATGSGT